VSQIGYYYPALMFGILAIYPLSRVISDPEGGATKLSLQRSGLVLVGLFAFFQIYPSLVSKNRVISGVGRTFALNMFESRFDCDAYWIEHFKDGQTLRIDAKDKSTDRIECEPIYYYSKSLNRCRQGAADPKFSDMDLFMDVGRKDEIQKWQVIHQSNFCSTHPRFNLFFPNPWIED
jgi:hypothetical protein